MADPVFTFAIWALLLGWGFFERSRSWIRQRGTEWREALEHNGLRTSAQHQMFGWTLHGRCDDLIVTGGRLSGDARRTLVKLELRPVPWNGGNVAIWSPRSGEASNPTHVRTGDLAFDLTVFLSGPPDRLLAVLDRQTREAILWIVNQAELTVGAATLSVQFAEGELNSAPRKFLEVAMAVARRLGISLDIPLELANRALADKDAAVREQCLLALVRGHSEQPQAREALLAACSDPSPSMRLAAGRELGEEGVTVLIGLLDPPDVGDEVSAAAVAALGRRLPLERLEPLLKLSLRKRRLETALVCVELAGKLRAEASAPVLARILEVEKAPLAAAAATALGALAAIDSEGSLVTALGRDEPEVARAAVAALARVGTTAAVLPLRRFVDGDHGEQETRRAVEQAIAAIHSRAPHATPGQLSLARSSAGALSLPQAEAGGLSFPPDERGRLSLPAPGEES